MCYMRNNSEQDVMKRLYGPDYAQFQLRRTPKKYLLQIITLLELNSEDVVLELGAGSGYTLHALRPLVKNIIGIEPNAYAAQHALEKDAIIVSKAEDLPLPDNSITKSLSVHVIEHIRDLSQVFKELDRVTMPNGLSLQIFPAPYLFRQEGALFETLRMTPNPIKAWQLAGQLHAHKLNPEKISEYIEGTSWKILAFRKIFVVQELGFSWVVLLQKTQA